ncbi:MAG: hypothetical protein J6D02_09910 [Lachnospira sp.]|nr:hypothetical protein [Lachnospira sp.]
MKNILLIVIILISLVPAFFLYLHVHPEDVIKREEAPVTMEEIKKNRLDSSVGYPAGDDIVRISGKADFEEMNSIDRFTIEPKSVIKTDVGSRKKWQSAYYSVRSGKRRTRKKTKPQVLQGLDIMDYYNTYYLMECPDGTYILAQLPHKYVKMIQKGEKVTLPICMKDSITKNAQDKLAAIGKQYDAAMQGVLYCFDDTWMKEQNFKVMAIRIGASVVLFFVISVGLVMLSEKLFRVNLTENE